MNFITAVKTVSVPVVIPLTVAVCTVGVNAGDDLWDTKARDCVVQRVHIKPRSAEPQPVMQQFSVWLYLLGFTGANQYHPQSRDDKWRLTKVSQGSGCRRKQRKDWIKALQWEWGWLHLVLILCSVCFVSLDDEHIRHDDGHTSGAPQEPQHQNMAGPHRRMGPHFQHRYTQFILHNKWKFGCTVCTRTLDPSYKPLWTMTDVRRVCRFQGHFVFSQSFFVSFIHGHRLWVS